MTSNDRRAFATLLYGLGETFNETVSDMRAEIYFRALSDLSLEDVKRAAATHAATSRFFPKPVELREAVIGNAEDRAEIAWAQVVREVKRVGWNGRPTWPDEATKRAAMDLFGGWRALCENLPAGGPELLGVAKNFKASFGAYTRRDAVAALPPSREVARNTLGDLRQALLERGLPTGKL